MTPVNPSSIGVNSPRTAASTIDPSSDTRTFATGSSPLNAERPSAKNVFVGVAWPYVNGDLHIGHLAGYLLPADVVARYHRLTGNSVLMASGSDCFGTPITVEADKRGITPTELVEEYHPRIVKLFQDLQLSFDIYTRTTSPTHQKLVQDFFVTLFEKGLITKGVTRQYFSPAEDRFLPDRYVEGTCPCCAFEKARSDQCDQCSSPLAEGDLINPVSRNTNTKVELRPTEHYFLDWPKLQPFLEEYVGSNSASWRPWVAAETHKWLKTGLKPRAITRDLNWGVPIPVERLAEEDRIDNHEGKRIYVWFDAVIGYLSASQEWAQNSGHAREWEVFWRSDDAKHYYFMGKDNLVFHTLFWPGQLHGFDSTLHLPDVPAINNFLTHNGEKFSKSRGVFVDPHDVIEKFGLDAVRFFICMTAPESNDSDFTFESLIAANNGILVAKVGNFVHRTLTLAADVKLNRSELSDNIMVGIEEAFGQATRAVEAGSVRGFAEAIVNLSEFGNKYLSEQAPWSLRKLGSPLYDPVKFITVMNNAVAIVTALNVMMRPIVPQTTERLDTMLGTPIVDWPKDIVVAIKDAFQYLTVSNSQPLFRKFE